MVYAEGLELYLAQIYKFTTEIGIMCSLVLRKD